MTKHIGTWALVRVEAVDAEGKPVVPPPFGGENFIGRVVLTAENRLSAMITDARPVIPDGEVRDYSCYTGIYTFDGKTLITKVDACSDPARMGTEQIRDDLRGRSDGAASAVAALWRPACRAAQPVVGENF